MDKLTKEQVIRRLLIAEGHVKKVKKMVEEGNYCLDVIHQSQAIQSALRKVDEIVLHGHLHTCVLHDVHGTKSEKEKLVEEVLGVFRKTDLSKH